MIKGFRQIASLTALSRIFGLVRDMAFGYFFGAGGLMDAWVIAFRIPNLARRLFGEGAASASFIPVYSGEITDNPKNAAKLANTVVTVIAVVLAAIVLIGWGGIAIYQIFWTETSEAKLILSLSAAMLPYMIMVCVVAILSGILNVHKHFAAPAAAPVILNIFIILSITVTGWFMKIPANIQVFAVAAAVLAAGVVQLINQLWVLKNKGILIRPAWEIRSEAFKKIMMLMLPMLLGLTATQINTLLDDLMACFLSGSQEKGEFFEFLGRQIQYPLWRGSVSHLYFSQRLYQFPLGVIGIALATAIFPVMSADAARKDINALSKTINRAFRAAIFTSIPAGAGLIIVARPLVSAILEHGKFETAATKATSWTLCFYSLGLCGFFLQQVVTRVFYSMQDSKTPMYSAIIAVVLNFLLNLILIWPMGTAGLALSTAVCSYLQVAILFVLLTKRFGINLSEGVIALFLKTCTGTAVMYIVGLAIMYVLRNLPMTTLYDVFRLLAVVTVAGGSYLVMAKVSKTKEIALITGGEY